MRESLIKALFEEIIEKKLNYTNSIKYIKELSYLSKDESACLYEIIDCWFEEH